MDSAGRLEWTLSNSKRHKPKSCFVYGCFSTETNKPNLGFHKFPAKGIQNIVITKKNGDKCLYDRRQIWIESLNIGKNASLVLDRVNVYVCSLHFARSDFYYNQDLTGKSYLKEIAVPRRNLPARKSSPLTTKFIVRKLNRRTYRGYTNVHNPDGRTLTAPRALLGANKHKRPTINPSYTKTVWVKRKTNFDQKISEKDTTEKDTTSDVTVTNTFSLKESTKNDSCEQEEACNNEQCTIVGHENGRHSNNRWFSSELIIKEEPTSDSELMLLDSNEEEDGNYWRSEPDLMIQNDAVKYKFASQSKDNNFLSEKYDQLYEAEELDETEDPEDTLIDEYEHQNMEEPEITIHEDYDELEDGADQNYNSYLEEGEGQHKHSDITVVHVDGNEEALSYSVQCHICGADNCETHMPQYTQDNYFVCLICSEMFTSQKLLALHSRGHTEMSEEEILLCKERTKKLTCDFCGRVLSTKATLREHIMIHTGEKPHQCLLCGKSFRHKANLVVHINGHAVLSSYKCKSCNKAFTKKIDFDKHLHVHVDSSGKPLVCKICNSVFKSQRTLYNHSQLHCVNGFVRKKRRGDKPKKPQFVCKICGRALSTKNTLKEHMMIHSGEKPHECKFCGRTIRHKANYIVHIQTHGQGRSFECDMCDEAFMRKSDLTQHKQLQHSKSKLLRCPICSEVFKSPEKFNRHMEIHESVVYMNETEELNEIEPNVLSLNSTS